MQLSLFFKCKPWVEKCVAYVIVIQYVLLPIEDTPYLMSYGVSLGRYTLHW